MKKRISIIGGGVSGLGAALLAKSKNNYVFCLSPDVEINKNCFDEIVELLKK